MVNGVWDWVGLGARRQQAFRSVRSSPPALLCLALLPRALGRRARTFLAAMDALKGKRQPVDVGVGVEGGVSASINRPAKGNVCVRMKAPPSSSRRS